MSKKEVNKVIKILEDKNSQDIEYLKKLLKRQKEIEDFISQNGFEASKKYKDEYSKITREIGRLSDRVDGDQIYGPGILSRLQSEVD